MNNTITDCGKCIVIDGFSMSFGLDGIWINTPKLNGQKHCINLKAEFNKRGHVLAPMLQDFLKEVRTLDSDKFAEWTKE